MKCFNKKKLKGVPSHWSSPAPAEYYLKLANVIKVGAPADLIAQDPLAVTEEVDLYSKYDSLKDFIIGFPTLAPSAQKRPLLVIV